jgi:tRNA/tmRNA/rRNA uracil-C5-methylase (TrmA/RlmC/RlmD family)
VKGEMMLLNIDNIDELIEELMPRICGCLCGHFESCSCCDGTYDQQLKSNREALIKRLKKYEITE